MVFFFLINLILPSFARNTLPVEFSNETQTCISKRALWAALETVMSGSSDSWLWPEAKSSILGEGLFENATIDVTYHAGWFAPTYTYVLEDVIPLETFTYKALQTNHPFGGGATISLSTVEEMTLLKWKGLYLTGSNDWFRRNYFKRFSVDFFESLEKKIKDKEKVFCL